MLHVVTLFSVSAKAEDAFVRSLRMGGDFHTLARRLIPEFIAADLLRHHHGPLFLCLDFWTTPEAYRRACLSPAIQNLFLLRRQMADSSFELSAFSFPAVKEIQLAVVATRRRC